MIIQTLQNSDLILNLHFWRLNDDLKKFEILTYYLQEHGMEN